MRSPSGEGAVEGTALRICHVTSMHAWDDDRIYQRACRRLSLMGHDVTLIATDGGGEAEDGVRWIRLKKRRGLSRRILTSFEALRWAMETTSDIVHVHDPDLLPWFLVAAWRGRKVVSDIHENYAERLERMALPLGLANLAAGLFKRFERFAVSRFSGVVTVTESMAVSFRDVARRVAVVGNVPDVGRLTGLDVTVAKFPRPTIYTSGSHSDARNCRQTVMALRLIRERVPDVRMMFAGRFVPEGYDALLRNLAAELGVGEALKLEGMLPWEENFNRTARAHVGCVFYEDNSNNRVTLPNRLFEYMVSGIPVLGEDLPEVRRVIEKASCGLLVNSMKPDSIAEAAIHLLTHPVEAREMGMRGRRAVLEHLNFEAEVKKLVALYRSVLAANGRNTSEDRRWKSEEGN